MTLRRKLVLGFVAFTVVPLGGAALLVHYSLTRHLERNAGRDLQSRVAHTASSLNTFVSQRQSDLRTYASDSVFASGSSDNIAKRLKQLSVLGFYFDELYFVSPQGRIDAATDTASQGRNIVEVFPEIKDELDEVGRSAARSVLISDFVDAAPEVLARTAEGVRPTDLQLEFLTPVLDPSGKPLGILVGKLGQGAIGKHISDLASRTAGSEAAYLLSADGRIVATASEKLRLLQAHPNWARMDAATVGNPDSQGFAIYRNFEGRHVLTGAAKTYQFGNNAGDWLVAAVMPYEETMAPALRIIRGLTWLLVTVLAIATLAGFLLARSVLRPLEAVTDAARRLQAGQLDARAPVTGRDETALLATAFNEMAAVRQKVEADLRESETRFRQLAENSTDVFWFLGLFPLRTLYINDAVETLSGLPGRRFYEDPLAWLPLIHPEDRAAAEKQFQAELAGTLPRYEAEYRVVRPDGTIRWVLASGTWINDDSGRRIRMGVIIKDTTERRQAESQRLRTQRLESIGTLAGGLAHDLNNSLAPILMGLELLRTEVPRSADIINTMETSAKRGADMVRQLVTFAKGRDGARRLLQPHGLLVEMEKLIRGTFPKSIQLRTNYAPEVSAVRGDATQLHQVLLNLCVNARDAMPDGGTLTLESQNTEVDAALATAAGDATSGPYVVWRVIDTGIGIPPEIIERIFDPFFTTKDPDKGTGLGLATVAGIVKSHGGFLRVYSVVGQGTTFAVYLPVAKEGEEESGAALAIDTTFRANGETVLLVDDEASVRDIARKVLSTLNFQVITAADGTEALMQVAEKRGQLRAVITDLHMPHMDGLTFVRVLKRMLPEAGIIVASGRLDEADAKQFASLGVTVRLEKPFTQQKLVEALKSVLQN